MRLVDTREPWELREQLIRSGWEQATLHHGDFRWTAHDGASVGATRKTVSDLLSSLGEVFAKQLEQMLAEYDICVFVLEGVISWDRASMKIILNKGLSTYTRAMIANWLHRWCSKGFVLERTADLGDTVGRLNELYALYQKPYSRSAITRRFADDRVLALPSGVRGQIGEKLLEGKSLFELARMSIPELESFDGIGSKRAYDIYQHFHRR